MSCHTIAMVAKECKKHSGHFKELLPLGQFLHLTNSQFKSSQFTVVSYKRSSEAFSQRAYIKPDDWNLMPESIYMKPSYSTFSIKSSESCKIQVGCLAEILNTLWPCSPNLLILELITGHAGNCRLRRATRWTCSKTSRTWTGAAPADIY